MVPTVMLRGLCRWTRLVRLSTAVFLLLGAGSSSAAQDEVEILFDPMQCWPSDEFLLFESTFRPPEEILSAKFYLRSVDHPDYYFVQLTTTPQGLGKTILPMAETSTSAVSWYVEVVTRSYNAFRSAENRVDVSPGDECKRRDPEAAYYNGQNPDIALGSTKAGVPQMAPGFQQTGISRFISVTGQLAAEGGGVSGKTLAIVGGGGGAVAAALLFTGGDSATSTTPPVGGTTVTTSATTTTATGGGSTSTTTATGGGSTTTTVGGGGTTTTVGGGGTTTTVVGSSTTTTGGSSTTTSPTTGPTTTPTTVPTTTNPTTTPTTVPTTTNPTTTPTTVPTTTNPTTAPTTVPTTTNPTTTPTTVPTTTNPTTTVPTTAPPMRDLSVTKSGSPNPVAVGQDLTYTITVRNAGPGTATTVVFFDNFDPTVQLILQTGDGNCNFGPATAQCSVGSIPQGGSTNTQIVVRPQQRGTIGNTVNVQGGQLDPNTGNNTASINTTVFLRDDPGDALVLAFTTDLKVPAEIAHGRLVVNEWIFIPVDSSSPRALQSRARSGQNQFEATLESGSNAEGSWHFDFSGSRHFKAGSLQVQSGEVLSQDGRFVVFAVRPGGPPIRFTIELDPAEQAGRE